MRLKISTLAVVFHGTQLRNILKILEHGIDPKRRTGQAHGPGEYFSVNPEVSIGFCPPGREMIVFLVVLPLEMNGRDPRKLSCPPDYVVVPTNENQLPLGVVRFEAAERTVLPAVMNARKNLQCLGKQIREQNQEKEEAALRGRIIQLIITDQLDDNTNFESRSLHIP